MASAGTPPNPLVRLKRSSLAIASTLPSRKRQAVEVWPSWMPRMFTRGSHPNAKANATRGANGRPAGAARGFPLSARFRARGIFRSPAPPQSAGGHHTLTRCILQSFSL